MKKIFVASLVLVSWGLSAIAALPTVVDVGRDLSVMGSPGSSLTNPVMAYATNTLFGFFAAPVIFVDVHTNGYETGWIDTNCTLCPSAYGITSGVQPPTEVTFQWTGTEMEVRVFAISGGYMSISDGIDTTNLIPLASDGWAHWYRVQYPTRGTHTLRIALDPGAYFSGINVEQGDSISAVTAAQKKLIVLADSYGTGYIGNAGSAEWTASYPLLTALMVTNIHAIPSAAGGTGVWNPATPPKTNYISRFYTDIVSNNPDWLVIQMSINDGGYEATNVTGYYDLCTNLFWLAKNIYSNRVAVLGICDQWDAYGGSNAQYYALNTNSLAAATAVGLPYFDAFADKAIPAWSGYFGGDGVHPNVAGYTAVATYLNSKMTATYGVNWTGGSSTNLAGGRTINYTLAVNNGSGSGNYTNGQVVSITAASTSNYKFTNWSGLNIANTNLASTTVTMPASNLVVTANLVSMPSSSSLNIASFGAVGDATNFIGSTVSNSVVIGTPIVWNTNATIGKVMEVFRAGPWTYYYETNSVFSTNQDTICLITNVTDGTNLWISIPQGWTKNAYCIVGTNNQASFQAAINTAQSMVSSANPNITINIPDGRYLIVAPRMLTNYIAHEYNDAATALTITSGGLTILGQSTNTVLMGCGAGMEHQYWSRGANWNYSWTNTAYNVYLTGGCWIPMRGSLFQCLGPITNSQYPLVFENLTLDGGLTNGLQSYGYWIPIPGNGDGWDTSHHALVDVNPNGTPGDPLAQMNQMKVFTNCVFQHWRGEMVICTTGVGGTNTFNDLANCTFYDGNASADNLYYGQHVHGCTFNQLVKVMEYYQGNATLPTVFENNLWTNIVSNPLTIVGSTTNVNPPNFTIKNNTFYCAGSQKQITFSPAENVQVISNTFIGFDGTGISFNPAGIQPSDGSATSVSNIVIAGNSFNNNSGIMMEGITVMNVWITNNTENTINGDGSPRLSGFCSAVGNVSGVFLANNTSPNGGVNSSGIYAGSYFSVATNNAVLPALHPFWSFYPPESPTILSYADGWQAVIQNATNNMLCYLDDSHPAYMPTNGTPTLQVSNATTVPVTIYLSTNYTKSASVLLGSQATQSFYWNGSGWQTNAASNVLSPPTGLKVLFN